MRRPSAEGSLRTNCTYVRRVGRGGLVENSWRTRSAPTLTPSGHDGDARCASGLRSPRIPSSDGTPDMHTYQQRWSDDPALKTLPRLDKFRFTEPLDVVEWAELDPVLRWLNNPDVWHLDSKGRFRCGSQGSSLDSVRTFAADLDGLLACRQTELGWPCPSRWLILESRHPWPAAYGVREEDEQAFGALRRALA